METRFRICPFCEATCGLALEVEGGEVRAVRGHEADVFSRGFLCPKGVALADLHRDPDRLRRPLVRRGGRHVAVSWDEAFEEIERRLPAVRGRYGNACVAVYLGNPTIHTLGLALYGRVLIRALRTPNVFSASTVDQMPKQLAAGLMFGTYLSVPVPDIERTEFLLMLGANPMESNGSLWTVPDFPAKLRALRARGGRCVVIDPRRTRTARAAGEHVPIRPGTDAFLLAAMANVLFAEERIRPGRLGPWVNGVEEAARALRPFTAEAVAPITGVPAERIAALARDLAAAPAAAVYGRIGTCTQEFGTLASWLVDLLNVITGNLDRPGGAMFPRAPGFAPNTYGKAGSGPGVRLGRRRSRVRGLPEVAGELPVACLAEEIETPGDGQIRALVTIAGNPVLSTPDSERLDRALASLDFMLSFDIYLNETTRHADVILPGLSPLEQPHYDIAFPQFAYRNVARYSPPVFDPPADRPLEWESLLRVAGIAMGQGADSDVGALDDLVAATQAQRAASSETSPAFGRSVEEILAAVAPRKGPERLLDIELRAGPYGDGFGTVPGGLTLARLEAEPGGVDLGPLEPRVPELLRTPSGKIELAPAPILADLPRLEAALRRAEPDDGFLLVGRRHLRSNNSWMHNLPSLIGGRDRCTLQINPADAGRLGVFDGARVRVTSDTGTVEARVEITDEVMPGVVSLPHGWGHDRPGTGLRLAARAPGVNVNVLASSAFLDVPSGNAVLNGIRVRVQPL